MTSTDLATTYALAALEARLDTYFVTGVLPAAPAHNPYLTGRSTLMTSPSRKRQRLQRQRLSEALEDLRRAREEVEALLAERSGSPRDVFDFDSSRRLRDDLHNVIALDALRREEKRLEERAKPTTTDLFAETLEAAFERSRRPASLDDFVEGDADTHHNDD